MGNKEYTGVFVHRNGVRICFGAYSIEDQAQNVANRLRDQTYLIPPERVVPEIKLEKLGRDPTLWYDGRFRQVSSDGQIILSPRDKLTV